MMILYWCPACRSIHPDGDLLPPTSPGGPQLCRRTGSAVRLRALRDDPDDERYGTPRCALCQLEIPEPLPACPACGTATTLPASGA